jgi:hypothetical protein
MNKEKAVMKRQRILSVFLLCSLGGCPDRTPQNGCPWEETEVPPDAATPWGTVFEDDLSALAGPFLGTLTWFDGSDVITVPKAGQVIEVEAVLEFDLSTTRKYTRPPGPDYSCAPEQLRVDAELLFQRVDDGEIELSVPVTVDRDSWEKEFRGEAMIMPVTDVAEGLDPMVEHDVEGVHVLVNWRAPDGDLTAEFVYGGQTTDSPTTGHFNSIPIAEFGMPL